MTFSDMEWLHRHTKCVSDRPRLAAEIWSRRASLAAAAGRGLVSNCKLSFSMHLFRIKNSPFFSLLVLDTHLAIFCDDPNF